MGILLRQEIHTQKLNMWSSKQLNDKNLELFCLIHVPGNTRGEFLCSWNKIPMVLSDNIYPTKSKTGQMHSQTGKHRDGDHIL